MAKLRHVIATSCNMNISNKVSCYPEFSKLIGIGKKMQSYKLTKFFSIYAARKPPYSVDIQWENAHLD